MLRATAGLLTIALFASAAIAQSSGEPAAPTVGEMPAELPGWKITETQRGYEALVARLDEAVKASPLNVVTRASATVGAKNVGKTIPGNMVVGVYAPRFALRMLDASVPAGIEAPLRFYITENEDGTATLSYKLPSYAFAPYDDGGEALDRLAAELDEIMASIAAQAALQQSP